MKTPPATLNEFWNTLLIPSGFLADATDSDKARLRECFFMGAAMFYEIFEAGMEEMLIGGQEERNGKMVPYLRKRFEPCRVGIAKTGMPKAFKQKAENAFVLGGISMPCLHLTFMEASDEKTFEKFDCLHREIDEALRSIAQEIREALPYEPCPCGSGKKFKFCCRGKFGNN